MSSYYIVTIDTEVVGEFDSYEEARGWVELSAGDGEYTIEYRRGREIRFG